MSENSFDDCRILQEADDDHRAVTLGTNERIDFQDLLDEPGPMAAALHPKPVVFALPLFIDRLDCRTGTSLFAPLANVGVTAVKPQELLPFVRKMGDQGSQPIQGGRDRDAARCSLRIPIIPFGFTGDGSGRAIVSDSFLVKRSVRDSGRGARALRYLPVGPVVPDRRKNPDAARTVTARPSVP